LLPRTVHGRRPARAGDGLPSPDNNASTRAAAGRRAPRGRAGWQADPEDGPNDQGDLRATSESLWASASGRLAIGGSRKVYKLRGVGARFIARDSTATLALKLPRNALSAVGRALRRHHRVRAELKLSMQDAAGNVAAQKRTIKLVR
jgi:hypothetical protein